MRAWRHLLALIGRARTNLPEPDMTNVIDLKRERLKRMPPIMLVGFISDRDVREAERRRADDWKNSEVP